MSRRWVLLVALAVVIGPTLIGLAYDRAFKTAGTGSTNLEVEFVVTDTANGAPVDGARLTLEFDNPIRGEPRDVRELVLTADTAGTARRAFPSNPTYFGESGLGLTNWFQTYPPFWRLRVEAAGFEPRERKTEHTAAMRAARPVGPGRSRLVVPVPLTKMPLTVPPR